MASLMLLLPQPFGPTMAAMPLREAELGAFAEALESL
jgi:hypothetical protein